MFFAKNTNAKVKTETQRDTHTHTQQKKKEKKNNNNTDFNVPQGTSDVVVGEKTTQSLPTGFCCLTISHSAILSPHVHKHTHTHMEERRKEEKKSMRTGLSLKR